MQHINIAIDGYAGSGKSTLAKMVAQSLKYTFVDTGALYRASTMLLLDNGYPIEDEAAISRILNENTISYHPEQGVQVNGNGVEDIIRSKRVASKVSEVAAKKAVRTHLLDVQQRLISKKAVVMEGRDIGTVIMPNAQLKLFITADFETRAQRRLAQMDKGGAEVKLQDVKDNLAERDKIDSTRAIAPLSIASDAIIIDNSDVNLDELLRMVIALARPLIDTRLLPHLR